MTHTKRIYNNPKSGFFVHPYHMVCCGNCDFCKDESLGKKWRMDRKKELVNEFIEYEGK